MESESGMRDRLGGEVLLRGHPVKVTEFKTWGLWFRVMGTLLWMSPTELGEVGGNGGGSVRASDGLMEPRKQLRENFGNC